MLTDKDIGVRHETMFRVGIMLGNVMESTALNPGNLMFAIAIHKNPSIRMVESVEWAQHSLNAISLDDHRILKLDAVKDLQLLANIHNILTQFKRLGSLKNDHYGKLQGIQMRLGKPQKSMTDSIRQAGAEFCRPDSPAGVHINLRIYQNAEILASKIPISEARQAFIELLQAYHLQTHIPGHRLSKAGELPPITKFATEEWHRDYLSHVATTGIRVIPFGIVFRWWIDYQRKLMSSDQEKTTPIVQALIDQAYISKTKWAEGPENQRWIQEDKMAFDSATQLADSMTGFCKNIPLPRFIKPNPRTETQLPIYTQFKVHPQAREDFQESQKILGQIYSLFEKDSCSALAIISKACYTKKENYLKIMAGDQQRFS
ncbi:hypothetical protein L873DRAFT_1793850 [Choiromyces venosus 120613-1]|uniref:Uncharacterized protein n=1 Tax=Choiromyces venosus 120613-1 TaxID=1336337 RepID=A0A3N4J461_9PEZI|nr:hypothetical protein L873DRAFT_1793850 [Choiromyces venosus 120613-1]